jgi:hypothetical protein
MGNAVTNKHILINDSEYELKGDTYTYTYSRDPSIHLKQVSEILHFYDKLNADNNLYNKNIFIDNFIIYYKKFINIINDGILSDQTFGAQNNVFTKLIDNGLSLGGEKYTDAIEDITLLKNIEFDGCNLDILQHNILIMGAGPIGLGMGIILKQLMPTLNINIIEKRVMGLSNNKLTRKLTRNNGIAFNIYSENVNLDERTLIANFLSKYGLEIGNFITSDNYFFTLPTEIMKSIIHYIKNGKILINILEYTLSKYAIINGCNIVHTKNGLEQLTNDKTIMIFDATGGRLLTDATRGTSMFIDKSNWYVLNDQKNGDGFNLKPIIFFGNIMCVSIGDSLYRSDYMFGQGIYLGLTFCLIIACLLKDYIDTIM